MKLRTLNNIIHRDLGYLCFGLTILYVVSGVAVNHIHDWNPTYKIEHLSSQIDLSGVDRTDNNGLALTVLGALGETSPLKNIFRVDDSTLKIFVVNNNITIDIDSGLVSQEKSNKRPVLYEANFLHLNHAKKWWTWFADLYAIALGILAITGLFVLRGKKGISGRGAWLAGAGLLIQVFFLWLYS